MAIGDLYAVRHLLIARNIERSSVLRIKARAASRLGICDHGAGRNRAGRNSLKYHLTVIRVDISIIVAYRRHIRVAGGTRCLTAPEPCPEGVDRCVQEAWHGNSVTDVAGVGLAHEVWEVNIAVTDLDELQCRLSRSCTAFWDMERKENWRQAPGTKPAKKNLDYGLDRRYVYNNGTDEGSMLIRYATTMSRRHQPAYTARAIRIALLITHLNLTVVQFALLVAGNPGYADHSWVVGVFIMVASAAYALPK